MVPLSVFMAIAIMNSLMMQKLLVLVAINRDPRLQAEIQLKDYLIFVSCLWANILQIFPIMRLLKSISHVCSIQSSSKNIFASTWSAHSGSNTRCISSQKLFVLGTEKMTGPAASTFPMAVSYGHSCWSKWFDWSRLPVCLEVSLNNWTFRQTDIVIPRDTVTFRKAQQACTNPQ